LEDEDELPSSRNATRFPVKWNQETARTPGLTLSPWTTSTGLKINRLGEISLFDHVIGIEMLICAILYFIFILHFHFAQFKQ